MEEIYLLWLLSISMLICSFVSGLVPMAFKMSDNKSRLLALMGSGILVGTALTIIIPEGIDSLYGQKNVKFKPADEHTISSEEPAKPADASITHHHSTEARSPFQTTDANMTWQIGASLIVGFVLMLIIDQYSIYQSGGHHHHHNYHSMNSSPAYEVSKTPRLGGYTLASQDDDIDIGMEEDDKTVIDDPSNEMKPIKNSDSHNVQMRSAPDYAASSVALGSLNNVEPQDFSNNVDPNRYYDHSKHTTTSLRVKNTKVTPTLGLVIHAAADGIALGAAATTSHRDIEMIIFLAIMLHKAPAAFSLVVLLLHNGLKPATIRRHLMAFSLSAPIAAIVTYYGLSQQGKEALQRNNATGVAMLFSAGTFLFVATVHVLPELIQNKLLTPREMMFLLSGAFLPLLLAQTV